MTTSKLDPLKNIKYLGYCLSQLPSGDLTLKDFIRYAKFNLAVKTKRLLKDPIWDSYTAEELLTEFFAHQFDSNPEFLKAFELDLAQIEGKDQDFASWADSEIELDTRQREKTLASIEDRISFSPSDILGD
jgi:hypothetical protein